MSVSDGDALNKPRDAKKIKQDILLITIIGLGIYDC